MSIPPGSLPPSADETSPLSTPAGSGESLVDDAPATVTSAHARWATVAIASGLFMEFIDSTALSTALPTLARAFHTDPLHLKLALTSYLLALAVAAPASGWLADRCGAKRVFMTAMAVFLAGSVLSGMSRTLGGLVACRLLQGVGGAMMTPVGRLIIVASTPRAQLVSAMSWFTLPALVGPVLGPPLAGIVLGVAPWPWIFYLNVPVCLAGLVAVAYLVPDTRAHHPGSFDGAGFLYVALAVSALTVATETIGMDLMSSAFAWTLGGGAAVLAAIYVHHATRTRAPVLDLGLLRIHSFRASVIGGFLLRLSLGASPLLLPLLLQVALGWSPLKAGVVSIWQTVGAILSRPIMAPLVDRYGYRKVLLRSLVIVVVASVAPAFFRASTPIALFVAVFLVSGFIRSVHFTVANVITYTDLRPGEVSSASTLSTVMQQVGLAMGVSFGGAVFSFVRGSESTPLTPERFLVPYLAVGLSTLLAYPVFAGLPPAAGEKRRAQREEASAGMIRR